MLCMTTSLLHIPTAQVQHQLGKRHLCVGSAMYVTLTGVAVHTVHVMYQDPHKILAYANCNSSTASLARRATLSSYIPVLGQ